MFFNQSFFYIKMNAYNNSLIATFFATFILLGVTYCEIHSFQNSLITSCENFLSLIAIFACYSLQNSLLAKLTCYAL